MPATEARPQADRRNARSTAPEPTTTSASAVVPPVMQKDVDETTRRLEAFRAELQPSGEVGQALVRRAAVLSVRLDRCVSWESAALAERVRRAEADFVAPVGLDAAAVEQLRAEAKALALFDASKEATLARKYEAAVERGFFRALKELRQYEKQVKAAAPAIDDGAFREMLASFSQFEAEARAIEDDLFDEDLRTRANPLKPPVRGPIPPIAGPVDVPITIGRRR